ncbi:hypothetical protein PIB30_049894 [Stylosanthes scabra]|uniref:Uncharacterized protein n=1 Tax=Stylosanthes scabra TaxID=79078 RepID=A0ABU6XIT2_9FABA|nr:hypothetical protein [Stylosanthes scabra]
MREGVGMLSSCSSSPPNRKDIARLTIPKLIYPSILPNTIVIFGPAQFPVGVVVAVPSSSAAVWLVVVGGPFCCRRLPILPKVDVDAFFVFAVAESVLGHASISPSPIDCGSPATLPQELCRE